MLVGLSQVDKINIGFFLFVNTNNLEHKSLQVKFEWRGVRVARVAEIDGV